jgi:hypothetical protein
MWLTLRFASVPKNTIAYENPDDGDQQVDRPLELGVFLARRVAERQRDRGQHDDRLPSPERERGEAVGEEAHLAGPLDHVVRRGKQRTAAEGEDDRVGMERPQPSVRKPGRDVQFRPQQLRGDDHADQHATTPQTTAAIENCRTTL